MSDKQRIAELQSSVSVLTEQNCNLQKKIALLEEALRANLKVMMETLKQK